MTKAKVVKKEGGYSHVGMKEKSNSGSGSGMADPEPYWMHAAISRCRHQSKKI